MLLKSNKNHYNSLRYVNIIGLAQGQGDRGSIPGRVIPKNQKIVLDAALFNYQLSKERIKVKVEQSSELCNILRYTLVWWLMKKEPSGYSRLRSPVLFYLLIYTYSLLVSGCVYFAAN